MKNKILIYVEWNWISKWVIRHLKWMENVLVARFPYLRALSLTTLRAHRSFYWHSKSAFSSSVVWNTSTNTQSFTGYASVFIYCVNQIERRQKFLKMDPLDEWLNNSTQSTFQMNEPAFPLDNSQHWNTSTNLTVNTSK